MKLIIDRSRWLRGDENSYLLRVSDRKMDALGFYCLAKDIPERHLLGMTTPGALLAKHPEYADKLAGIARHATDGLVTGSTGDAWHLMNINDYGRKPDAERESQLKEMFKHYLDVDLEFV